MGVKLSDYIKNPKEVFTEEEAREIYLAAGYIEKEHLENNNDNKIKPKD